MSIATQLPAGRRPIELALRLDRPLWLVERILDDWLEMGVVEEIGDLYRLTAQGHECAAALSICDPKAEA